MYFIKHLTVCLHTTVSASLLQLLFFLFADLVFLMMFVIVQTIMMPTSFIVLKDSNRVTSAKYIQIITSNKK
jgi:hypothetical protein